MKKIKSFKLFAGIALFMESMLLVSIIIVLSIQKKSIPKAVIAILAAGSVLSAWLLISYKKEEERMKKLRAMDAFYDYDYDLAYNGLDDEEENGDDDENDGGYDLGIDENLNPIRD